MVWLLSGFKGTCFLPVGTCLIGQLTSWKDERVKLNSTKLDRDGRSFARSERFDLTLRFLWQTLTSSTSKDTEFCSFSEFWDGFSVRQQQQEFSVNHSHPSWYINHLLYSPLASVYPSSCVLSTYYIHTRLLSWQHRSYTKFVCVRTGSLVIHTANRVQVSDHLWAELHFSPSPLSCSSTEWSEPWIRCSHVTASENDMQLKRTLTCTVTHSVTAAYIWWQSGVCTSVKIFTRCIWEWTNTPSTQQRVKSAHHPYGRTQWRLTVDVKTNWKTERRTREITAERSETVSTTSTPLRYLGESCSPFIFSTVCNISSTLNTFLRGRIQSHAGYDTAIQHINTSSTSTCIKKGTENTFRTFWRLFYRFCETWRWASCAKIWAKKREIIKITDLKGTFNNSKKTHVYFTYCNQVPCAEKSVNLSWFWKQKEVSWCELNVFGELPLKSRIQSFTGCSRRPTLRP